MTSATPTSQSQPTAASNAPAAVASSSTSGTSTPSAAVPAQLPIRSYASAATKSVQDNSQHGKVSPVNGAKNNAPQTNTNNMQNGEHGRKPSVIISASGTSGQIPNGATVSQSSARPNINFGSMNGPSGSPAIATSVPHQPQTPSLNAPKDPRVTSPTHSPSPIPQPAASGGKPPSNLPGQSNGLSFGSMGAENGENRGPQAPLTPGQQPAHLRRESSQSTHSDMSMRGGFVPQGGRGRGSFNGMQYPPSPAQNFRQPLNNRGGPGNMQPFQNPAAMGFSPGGRGRGGSPMMSMAQPFVPGQPQMHGGYPQQHLNPQQQAYYGAQPPYDPAYGYYQPFYPQQQFPHGAAPPSPRPSYPVPYGGPPQHNMPSFHNPMSRSGSQISERPGSSVGQPTAAPAAPSTPGTPAQATSNFQIPVKKASKAIVIKNDKGEEVTFEKKPSPAPSAVAQSPAIVSSAPTPPPRTPSVQHNRAESTAKSATETKNQFQEQVKAQLEARKAKEEEEKRLAQEKVNAQAKVVKDKEDADAKVIKDKEDAEAKDAQDKKDAEAKAEQEKKDAEAKAAQDKADAEKKAADEKEAAEKKAAADKAAEEEKAAADKAAAEKATADKATADKEAADKKASEDAEKAAAESAKAAPAEAEETEEERFEREIAEMEAREKEEEERERAYEEKKAKEREANKAKEAEAAKKADEEMKRMEREAEELELAREKEREGKTETSESDKDAEAAKLFASLKKPAIGPGADGAEAPASEPEPSRSAASKPKPSALKLDTNKPVEAAQPTPGMKSLQSARFLDLKSTSYPDGFKSPNPALNQTGKRVGKEYDMDFLLQFQNIFKEKPSVDWDNKVKETLGDGEPASARGGARTASSMGGRQGSRGTTGGNAFTAMGSFANQQTRTLPPGTSSSDRFAASQAAAARGPAGMGGFSGGRGGFPMGGTGQMSRTNSMQTMAPGSPKVGGSSRRGGGGGGSRRGPSQRHDDRREADAAKTMPLTAGMDLKPLEKSTTGWTPRSIGAAPQPADTTGQMAPDMVQRKVKAALNKMTPENFERISDQIMAISDQSKNEKDGRTLRQVIQLTFEKACDEAHWAGTYAKFCSKMLHSMSNEIVDETIRDKNNNPVVGGGLFRKYLLNRCQEEFERGWEANLPEKPEGESQEAALLSDEYYIAAAAKRRGLGLIQFIGELYKLGMLTVKIMHQCVLRLLNFEGQPDESAVENLSKLLKAVGSTMDSTDQGHQLVDMYYQRLQNILDTHKDMPSRSRFMLMDIVDLRKSGWKSRDSDKGPKTIEQIHAEAEAAQAAAELERQKNSSQRGGRPQMGRGDARGFGQQNMPPPDYTRNTVGMDDLRRLQNRGASRQASGGMGPLGPGGFMASRSSSGRKGLGPPRDGESSGPSSRSGTPLNQKKDEPTTHANAFSALAALDGAMEPEQTAPSEAGSPPTAKAEPASIDATAAGDSANNA